MLFTRKTALWLAILPSTLAIDCTASNAIAIDLNSGSGGSGGSGGGGSSGTCSDLCGNDLTCLGLCDGSGAAVGAIKGRNLNVRATLSCTSNETCVTIEGLLVCIDANTGAFHDETGGSGNFISGEYTEGNGQKTTIGVEGTPTPTASTADSTATSPSTSAPPVPSTSDTETKSKTDAETKTEAETPVDGTPTTGASGSNTSAAPTPTSGVDGLSGRGAVVGALGLLVCILAN